MEHVFLVTTGFQHLAPLGKRLFLKYLTFCSLIGRWGIIYF
jgi:hypothetical protein